MKKVTETYVVDALSFSEAESSIIKEMADYISGDMEVKAIKIAPYAGLESNYRQSVYIRNAQQAMLLAFCPDINGTYMSCQLLSYLLFICVFCIPQAEDLWVLRYSL